MCTAKCAQLRKASMLEDVRARLQRTIGGLSDTEEKLFAVKPISAPAGPDVVTIVTPVAKEPNASRNARPSKPGPALAAPLRRSLLLDVGVVILNVSDALVDAGLPSAPAELGTGSGKRLFREV